MAKREMAMQVQASKAETRGFMVGGRDMDFSFAFCLCLCLELVPYQTTGE